ncbi:MAG: AAA family ATPase [Deltaproteobacteria bacterium]|nr:AAA family ATPase [Deltaproteobacteria bacterium]
MTKELPALPVGQQLFEELRLDNTLYVDKTTYLPMLRKAGKFVFCARPRRFGKSLTVHTLDAFHSGRKELFRGLAVEEHIGSPAFVSRPVINLDMGAAAGARSIEVLESKIMGRLGVNAERHHVSLRGADTADSFLFLIEDVHKASGKNVVVLIDEYDAPVISVVRSEKPANADLLDDTRNVMRYFYSKIKSAEAHIESVFITGVTRFSKMGVFSLLNNLRDISLNPEFGAFMGYTQKDLENYFKPFVAETARKLKMSQKRLLSEIRGYYYWFSFDGETRLYCPFSILSFFADRQFANYWMESGSDAIIKKFLKDKAITVEEFQGKKVTLRFARSPGEIESAKTRRISLSVRLPDTSGENRDDVYAGLSQS